jgi:hypothetical protein
MLKAFLLATIRGQCSNRVHSVEEEEEDSTVYYRLTVRGLSVRDR